MRVKECNKSIRLLLLAGLLSCLLACVTPSAAETDQQTPQVGLDGELVTDQESGADQKENPEEKNCPFLGTDTEYQPKVEKSQETKEQPGTVKIEGDSLRYLVADLLSKDADSTLLEKDLIEWVGKMESSDLTLESGKDIEFAVKYFDCLHVTEIRILDDLKWNDEQLQMLSFFPELTKLHFEADEKGISLDAVEKLSKLEELALDVKDAAALQQFRIPDQVKILKLYSEQGDLYRDLLASLKDSSVTELQINIQKDGEFTLDDIAGCPSLERLYVYSGALRIQNISTNWQLNSLEYMMFTADRQTDLRFVKELPSLEYVDIAITETLDAAPLFERKELGMYLQVARPKAESEDERYPDNQVVEVGLEAYTSLEEVELQQREYLAAYQQRFDEGRRIECFVLRSGGKEDVIFNIDPVIIVSGEKFHQVLPFEDSEVGFGSNRSDFIFLQDINFDNKKDIIIDRGETGNQLAHYEFAWCWDDRLQEYIYSSSYAKIMNPMIDSENSCIRSSWRNGAVSHGFAIYEYVNGRLLETSVMTETLVLKVDDQEKLPEGTQLWEWKEEKEVDGELQLTEYVTFAKIPGQDVVYTEAYYRLEKKYLAYYK